MEDLVEMKIGMKAVEKIIKIKNKGCFLFINPGSTNIFCPRSDKLPNIKDLKVGNYVVYEKKKAGFEAVWYGADYNSYIGAGK